jgi:muramoyltetrapeptide carboxypeptidase
MVKRILSERLKEGDFIGVVSASDPLKDIEKDKQFDSGIKFLKNMGFNIILGKNLSSIDPEKRAEDINNFFKDKKVKAIISSQGGDTSEKLLPFVDFEIIKKNPKILLGISDITVLLNAINTKTGLITFHGNDVKYGFGRNPTEYDKTEFSRILMNGSRGEIPANKERKTIRSGKAEGKLIGGNLYCLLKLIDTEYCPDFEGSVLFLEEYDFEKEDCESQLEKLKKLNVFDKIKGVIIGYIYGLQKLNPSSKQMEEILLEITKDYDFPILKVNDFGHNTPNTVLPVGAVIEMDADKKKIKLVEDICL